MWVTCALCSYYIWVIQVAGLEGQYTIYWHFIRRLNTISPLNSRLKKHHNGMSQSQNGYHGELDFQPRMHQKTLVGRDCPGSAWELTALSPRIPDWMGRTPSPPPGTRGKETHDTFPYRHSITLLSARSSPGRPLSIRNAASEFSKLVRGYPHSRRERATPSRTQHPARPLAGRGALAPVWGPKPWSPSTFQPWLHPWFSAQCKPTTSNE